MKVNPFIPSTRNNYLITENYKSISARSQPKYQFSYKDNRMHRQSPHMQYLKKNNPFSTKDKISDRIAYDKPYLNNYASDKNLSLSKADKKDVWKKQYQQQERTILKNFGPDALRYNNYNKNYELYYTGTSFQEYYTNIAAQKKSNYFSISTQTNKNINQNQNNFYDKNSYRLTFNGKDFNNDKTVAKIDTIKQTQQFMDYNSSVGSSNKNSFHLQGQFPLCESRNSNWKTSIMKKQSNAIRFDSERQSQHSKSSEQSWPDKINLKGALYFRIKF